MTTNIFFKAGLPLFLVALSVAPVEASILAPGSLQSGDFVLGPTDPGKWGSDVMGTGATVTWSLMGTAPDADVDMSAEGPGLGGAALASFMPVGFKAEIEAAFAAWSAVADITFEEVVDSELPFDARGATGEIRFGGHTFDGPGNVLAHAFYPPENGLSAAGDIHFDTAETWKIGFGEPGIDVFWVAAHEIGHAIGLGHTEVPNSLMNPFYNENIAGLQADDIAGAQYLYGPAAFVPEPSTFVVWSLLAVFGLTLARRRKAG